MPKVSVQKNQPIIAERSICWDSVTNQRVN
jgi:hypothetical protein